MKNPKRKRPSRCPYCDSNNSEMTMDEYSDKTKYRDVRRLCLDCGREWSEQYRFTKWVEFPL